MLLSYDDIRSRINEPPRWFDSDGVPRYVMFEPHHATISGREAALLEIACQACGTRFVVAEPTNHLSRKKPKLENRLRFEWIP